jgi:hypothetical protein
MRVKDIKKRIEKDPSDDTISVNNSHFINHILIVCIGLFVFFPCLFDFFVSDDFGWISRSVNLSFDDLFQTAEEATYNIFRPLIPPLFFIFHQFFGLSAFGYHVSSIVFHLLNTLLFYNILLHFSLRRDVAFVSSLIFVSHFAHEETVFWISSICVLCCWLFSLLSISAFLKWLKDGKTWFYFLSLSLGGIALFIREDALVLPLILSLIIFVKYIQAKQGITNYLAHKMKSTTLINLVPFFLVVLTYLYLRSLSLPHLRFGSLFSLNPIDIIRNLAYFLVNLTFPVRLVFDGIGYHHSRTINSALNIIDSHIIMVIAGFLGIVVSIFLFAIWVKKANKYFKLLVIVFLITLFPFLFFKGYGLRFTYLPLLGFTPIAAHFLLSFARAITSRSPWFKARYLYVTIIIIVFFNFLILSERHLWWAKASRTCEDIITTAGTVVSSLPIGSTVYFTELPTRIHGAYILNNGFIEAMSLFYPSSQIEIIIFDKKNLHQLREENAERSYLFEYEDGKFHQL